MGLGDQWCPEPDLNRHARNEREILRLAGKIHESAVNTAFSELFYFPDM